VNAAFTCERYISAFSPFKTIRCELGSSIGESYKTPLKRQRCTLQTHLDRGYVGCDTPGFHFSGLYVLSDLRTCPLVLWIRFLAFARCFGRSGNGFGLPE
jgi:hypothetical protein